MKLIQDLHIIEDDGRYAVYSPLKRVALSVNHDAVTLLRYLMEHPNESFITTNESVKKFFSFLEVNGLANSPDVTEPEAPQPSFEPTQLTLLPTFDCNLRCVYCFADSGETSKKYMDWEVAKGAIDLVISNAIRNNSKSVGITFHGGGEPTLAWSLITKATKYAQERSKEKSVRLRTHITTNGVLSPSQRKWLVENINRVQVSFDGMSEIQNQQRPMANSRESFPFVLDTIKFFEKQNYSYGVQSVITSLSVNRMKEIVDFFVQSTTRKELHFEALFECGRCSYSGWSAPDPEEYAKQYLDAWKYAKSQSIRLSSSSSRLKALSSTFCGAAGRNFFVTPDGNVTACLEVSNYTDERATTFIYGFFDKDRKQFVFDQNRLERLASRNVHNLTSCSNCAFKWHCAGDCPAKALLENAMFNPEGTNRCKMAKNISTSQLFEIISNPDYAHTVDIPVSVIQVE